VTPKLHNAEQRGKQLTDNALQNAFINNGITIVSHIHYKNTEQPATVQQKHKSITLLLVTHIFGKHIQHTINNCHLTLDALRGAIKKFCNFLP